MLRIKSMLSLYLAGLHTYDPFTPMYSAFKQIIYYVAMLSCPGTCYTVFKTSGFYMTVSFSLQIIVEDLFRIDMKMLIVILSTICILPAAIFCAHIMLLNKKSNNSTKLYFSKKDAVLFNMFIWLMEIYEILIPLVLLEILQIWRNFRYDLSSCELDSNGFYTIFPNKNYIFNSKSLQYYAIAVYATISYVSLVLLLLFYSLFKTNEYSCKGNSYQPNLMHFTRSLVFTYLGIAYLIEPNVT